MKITIEGKQYELDFGRAKADGYLKSVERPLEFGDLKVGDVFLFVDEDTQKSKGIFVKILPCMACRIAGDGGFFTEVGSVGLGCGFSSTNKVSVLKNGQYINTIEV